MSDLRFQKSEDRGWSWEGKLGAGVGEGKRADQWWWGRNEKFKMRNEKVGELSFGRSWRGGGKKVRSWSWRGRTERSGGRARKNGYLVFCKMGLKWKAKRASRKKTRKKSEIGLTGYIGVGSLIL